MLDPEGIRGLAAVWRHQIDAGNADSDDECGRTIDRADVTLVRLAALPSANAADLAAKVIVALRENHGGDTRHGLHLLASIVADCERFAGPALAGLCSPVVRDCARRETTARANGAPPIAGRHPG